MSEHVLVGIVSVICASAMYLFGFWTGHRSARVNAVRICNKYHSAVGRFSPSVYDVAKILHGERTLEECREIWKNKQGE